MSSSLVADSDAKMGDLRQRRRREFLQRLLVEKAYCDVFFDDFIVPDRAEDLASLFKVFSKPETFQELFAQLSDSLHEEKRPAVEKVFERLVRFVTEVRSSDQTLSSLSHCFVAFQEALFYEQESSRVVEARTIIKCMFTSRTTTDEDDADQDGRDSFAMFILQSLDRFTTTLSSFVKRLLSSVKEREKLRTIFAELGASCVEDAEFMMDHLVRPVLTRARSQQEADGGKEEFISIAKRVHSVFANNLLFARGFDAMETFVANKNRRRYANKFPFPAHLSFRIHNLLRRLHEIHLDLWIQPGLENSDCSSIGFLMSDLISLLPPEYFADDFDFKPLMLFMDLLPFQLTEEPAVSRLELNMVLAIYWQLVILFQHPVVVETISHHQESVARTLEKGQEMADGTPPIATFFHRATLVILRGWRQELEADTWIDFGFRWADVLQEIRTTMPEVFREMILMSSCRIPKELVAGMDVQSEKLSRIPVRGSKEMIDHLHVSEVLFTMMEEIAEFFKDDQDLPDELRDVFFTSFSKCLQTWTHIPTLQSYQVPQCLLCALALSGVKRIPLPKMTKELRICSTRDSALHSVWNSSQFCVPCRNESCSLW